MNKRKALIVIATILSFILLFVGVTYAYWVYSKSQTNSNVVGAGCLDISLDNEANDIKLTDQFPISDVDGMKLTPYEFTVTNNCTTSVDFQVNLESLGDQTTALKASSIKVALNDFTPRKLYDYVGVEPTISDAYEAYILKYGTLAANEELTYNLRIWIDYDAPNSEQNKTYSSKVSVSVGQNISSQGNTLASLILSHAEENNYLYTTTPNFAQATADGEYGIYKAKDDLGDSYYFRGDVTNNYVKFGTYQSDSLKQYQDSFGFSSFSSLEECEAAKGINYPPNGICVKIGYSAGEPMYWRIVRINGDGTIRMIYDGSTPVENGELHNAKIETNAFNILGDNVAHAGYTYKEDGVEIDSTIKTAVDNWYVEQLKNSYAHYIADSIFCNDRTLGSVSGTNEYYAAYDRIFTAKSPILSCSNTKDRYTVSNSVGNGYLSNPIGLLTADELLMSGANSSSDGNPNYYLYNARFWTMTPSYWNGSYMLSFIANNEGDIYSEFSNSFTAGPGVRPVINIKADALFKGTGIPGDPYELAS